MNKKDLKQKKCCGFGEYNCTIPMPIKRRVEGIDFCISDIVASLNASNIITVASCCGHGKEHGIISLEDGRQIIIVNVKKEMDEDVAITDSIKLINC